MPTDTAKVLRVPFWSKLNTPQNKAVGRRGRKSREKRKAAESARARGHSPAAVRAGRGVRMECSWAEVSPLCANWAGSIRHVFLFDQIPTFWDR